jgi:hypothetical protein
MMALVSCSISTLKLTPRCIRGRFDSVTSTLHAQAPGGACACRGRQLTLVFPITRGDAAGAATTKEFTTVAKKHDKKAGKKPFLTDIKTLRQRARDHIMQGAITPGYTAERETVVKLLNEALATEIVCVLRYKRHYFMATGHQRRLGGG